MDRRTITLLSVLVCAAAGCGGAGGSVGSSSTGPAATTEAPSPTGGPATDCHDLSDEHRPTISIENFKFVPKCVVMAAGSALTIDNTDSVTHTFTVTDTEIDATILAGGAFHKGSEGLAAGEYPYFCRIHPSMKGTLTVV